MMSELDRDKAVELFMRVLILHARNGSIEGVVSLLEQGPPGRKPSEELLTLHRWFQALDSQGQKYVCRLIQEAVDAALFSALVILDGAAGGYPVAGTLSDFALHLQTYADEDMYMRDTAQIAVRLNPANTTEDLHDIFMWALQADTA